MVTEPSPTSSPRPGEGARASASKSGTIKKTPMPVLASEALREDVAPVQPWDRSLRLWFVLVGVVLLAVGAGLHLHVLHGVPRAAHVAFSVGGGVVFIALVPFPYAVRGVLGLLVGMGLVGLGIMRQGPLAALVLPGHSAGWEFARTMAATALPAALLFRARYRAYLGARVALIVALVVALPASVQAGMVVATDPLFARVAAGLTLLAVLTSLMGFMGEQTTGASTVWAVFVLAMFGIDVMARSLWVGTGWQAFAVHVPAGVVFLGACTLTSLGLFQLLASAFAKEARQVDVLRKRQPSIHKMESLD